MDIQKIVIMILGSWLRHGTTAIAAWFATRGWIPLEGVAALGATLYDNALAVVVFLVGILASFIFKKKAIEEVPPL